MNLWQTTRLSVNPDWWDQDHQQLKSRMASNPEMRQSFNNEVADIRKYVSDAFYSCPQPDAIDHDWLARVVARYYREKDRKPKPRGNNTMCDLMKKLRAFFNWCERTGKMPQSPFKNYSIGTQNFDE